jgi:MFS family permease
MLTGLIVLIGGPLGHQLGGRLIDRAHRRGSSPVVALAIMFLLAAPCAALLGMAQSVGGLSAAYFTLVIVLGACAVAALAAYQPLIPDRMRGAGNAAYFATVSLVGTGLGPPLVGFLSDALGSGSQGALGPALGIVTAAIALPAAFLSNANRGSWSATASACHGSSERERGHASWARAVPDEPQV